MKLFLGSNGEAVWFAFLTSDSHSEKYWVPIMWRETEDAYNSFRTQGQRLTMHHYLRSIFSRSQKSRMNSLLYSAPVMVMVRSWEHFVSPMAGEREKHSAPPAFVGLSPTEVDESRKRELTHLSLKRRSSNLRGKHSEWQLGQLNWPLLISFPASAAEQPPANAGGEGPEAGSCLAHGLLIWATQPNNVKEGFHGTSESSSC